MCQGAALSAEPSQLCPSVFTTLERSSAGLYRGTPTGCILNHQPRYFCLEQCHGACRVSKRQLADQSKANHSLPLERELYRSLSLASEVTSQLFASLASTRASARMGITWQSLDDAVLRIIISTHVVGGYLATGSRSSHLGAAVACHGSKTFSLQDAKQLRTRSLRYGCILYAAAIVFYCNQH